MIEDIAERTETPTPRRLAEAREQGNVARSADLAAALLLAAVTVILWIGAAHAMESGKQLMSFALGQGANSGFDLASVYDAAAAMIGIAIRIALPILLLAWLAAYLATFAQIGWVFSSKPIQPTLARLNPIKGFHRIFGMPGFVKAGLDLLKVLLVLGVTAITIMQHAEKIAALPARTAMQGAQSIALLTLDIALRVLFILLVLGLLDLLFQRTRHERDLRMTRQQIKDELRQTEGNPDIKRIRTHQHAQPRRTVRTQRTHAARRTNLHA